MNRSEKTCNYFIIGNIVAANIESRRSYRNTFNVILFPFFPFVSALVFVYTFVRQGNHGEFTSCVKEENEFFQTIH